MMLIEILDTTGLKPPQPVLKTAEKVLHMKSGSILEVRGDSPGFESDLVAFCKRIGKTTVSVTHRRGGKAIRIRL